MSRAEYCIKACIHLAMISLILFMLINSISKYSENKKSVWITTVDVEEVMYPSVTVCKRRAFDDHINDWIHNESANLKDIEEALKENIATKDDIFYFVSHPNMIESNHPCMTTKDRINPGKPCIFPFQWNQTNHRKCIQL